MAIDVNLAFLGTATNFLTNLGTSATALGVGLDLHGATSTDIIREVRAFLRCAGPVAGTSPTADVKFQDSTAATTGYTDMGLSFSQLTTAMLAATSGETVPQGVVIRTRPGRRYVRAFVTVNGTGNTTNLFTGVSLVGVPVDRPAY